MSSGIVGNNCSASLLWPTTTPCGDRGQCVNNICLCEPGFTSFGDFSLLAQNACDLYMPAIQALWGLVAFSACATVVVAVWAVVASRKHLQLRAWRGWLMALSSLLQSALLLVLAILKFVDVEMYIVGGNTLFTVFNGLFISCVGATLYIALFGFIRAHSLMQVTRLGPELKARYERRSNRVNLLIAVSYLFVLPISLLPLVLIEHPQERQLIVPLHGVPLAVACVVLGAYYAPWLMRSVTRAVETTRNADLGKREQLERIMTKLRLMNTVAMIGFPFSAVWIIFFAFWPYFTVKGSYLLPLFYSLAVLCTNMVMWGAITTDDANLRRRSFPSLVSWILRPFGKVSQRESPDLKLFKSPAAAPLDEVKAPMPPHAAVAVYDDPNQVSEVKRTDVQEHFTQGREEGTELSES